MVGSTIVLDPYVVLGSKSTAESAGTSVVHAIWQAEEVAARTCTFVMFSGDDPPVLVPLTTPAQPFSTSIAMTARKTQT